MIILHSLVCLHKHPLREILFAGARLLRGFCPRPKLNYNGSLGSREFLSQQLVATYTCVKFPGTCDPRL